MGKDYPVVAGDDGYWYFHLLAPDEAAYTMFNALAFMYTYFPKGAAIPGTIPSKPVVRIFYGVSGVMLPDDGSQIDVSKIVFDANAGYTVFYGSTDNIY
ncbi:MAG: hypothetical protein LBU07_03035 [Coriobacteriales bacterium]|jgi:hypothetical protein|nr:hypothetical protein [Coriobacteriales bacterium]